MIDDNRLPDHSDLRARLEELAGVLVDDYFPAHWVDAVREAIAALAPPAENATDNALAELFDTPGAPDSWNWSAVQSADRAAAPEACGCGWEGGLRRYCDQHNPCFPTSLRNEARAAAPAPEPIVSPNEPHCGNCGGTQFETVPVVDGGEEERCLTCGESERVSSPADRAPAALAPEGLDFVVAQLRHAYHNLIGPDGPWDRDQRMRFADGLISPQIVRLEEWLRARPAALGDERAHLETIDQRDRAEEWADKLAYAVADIDTIGEHSNVNNPWANALDILQSRADVSLEPPALSDETLREMAREAEFELDIFSDSHNGESRTAALVSFARAVLARQQEEK